MKNRIVITYAGGGGSPEQSQRVVFGYQLDENYSQTSARRGRPRSYAQARALAFNAKGEKPAEPVPYLVPSDWTTKNPYCHSELVSESVPRCKLVPNIGQTLNQVQGDNRLLACVGFTMAEILLSLTIIGVVAAITLPSLTGNINERTWNTQRKALYARFSQAMPLIDSLNGYANAETFITGALGKVIKINNICDKEHLSDCGIASTFVNLAASTLDIPTTLNELNPALTSVDLDLTASGSSHYIFSGNNTDAAAFETGNGESIVVYYNPTCVGDMGETDNYYVQRKICAHFIYDLNGSKGPNTVNKDIGFMTAIYPTGTVVAAPFVHPQDASTALVFYDEAAALCTQQDAEYRMPNLWELISMMAARKMIGEDKFKDGYNTSALLQHQNTLLAWRLFVDVGAMTPVSKNMGKYKVRCVHR